MSKWNPELLQFSRKRYQSAKFAKYKGVKKTPPIYGIGKNLKNYNYLNQCKQTVSMNSYKQLKIIVMYIIGKQVYFVVKIYGPQYSNTLCI